MVWSLSWCAEPYPTIASGNSELPNYSKWTLVLTMYEKANPQAVCRRLASFDCTSTQMPAVKRALVSVWYNNIMLIVRAAETLLANFRCTQCAGGDAVASRSFLPKDNSKSVSSKSSYKVIGSSACPHRRACKEQGPVV